MTSGRIVIPLEKYGVAGEVIMSYPGFKKAQIAEAKSMALAVKFVDGEQQIDMERGYFAALEKASYFIESAPSKISGYESLLDLLDTVDKTCNGGGQDLMEAILKGMQDIIDGRSSPFVKSPGAVTGKSG